MKTPQLISDLDALGIKMHNQALPVYKYTSVNTAKLIIENCSIRFTVPSVFNDPFEFSLDLFEFDISNQQCREKFKRDLKMNQSLTRHERNKLVNQTTIAEYKTAYRKILNLQRELSLVFCSSEKNDDILMWSHYADFHRGVCIGFYLPTLHEKLDCLTMKVNYVEEMHPKNFFSATHHEKSLTLMNWIFTKSSCWSYEREVRSLIKNENDERNIHEIGFQNIFLSPSQVCEIYFGMNTSDVDIADIKVLLKKKGFHILKIGKMEAERGRYSLKPFPLQL